MWLRFLVVAAVAVFLIPALQSIAIEFEAAELVLLIAFIIILFMIKALIVTELAVSDEWMTSIFTSLLTVIFVFIIQRVVSFFFENMEMFSFI